MARSCSVEGCTRKHNAHGYCTHHAYRLRKYGDPLVAKKYGTRGEGHIDHRGYRVFRINGKLVAEQRLVWAAAYGPIPEGYHIHHINGDKLDNELSNLVALRKVQHLQLHTVKLADPQVAEIRSELAAGVSRKELAARYKVHHTTIGLIATGKHRPSR